MADHPLPTPSMDWGHPDRAQAFRDFKQIAEMWFKVKAVAEADQYNYIVLWSGREGLRMYNTWNLSEEDLKKPSNVWDKFSAQLEPTENFRIHRLEFQRFKQNDNETVDEFYTRCKAKAMKCKFTGDTQNERIIAGLSVGNFFY